jgi:acyl-[acyl carrier protein]--UDP-N-acetylglucosamine O-acyltransferase
MPNKIHPTAIIHDNVILGDNNDIGDYCVIGGNGDLRDCQDFKGVVKIGNSNRISEGTIIHRGREGETLIGNNNFIMANCYIAHNVEIGNRVEICAGSVIGGYAKLNDGSILKLRSVIRNRVKIGSQSLIGMGAVVTKDVPNNETWVGVPAKKYGST